MAKTITGTFATRQAVELAVEHLVQQYGIERTDVFIEPSAGENSSGVELSGGDADSVEQDERADDAPLNHPFWFLST